VPLCLPDMLSVDPEQIFVRLIFKSKTRTECLTAIDVQTGGQYWTLTEYLKHQFT
jgi:hypothetical protein